MINTTVINPRASELVAELRGLLTLSETDEEAALSQLHQLIATHGRSTVGAALRIAVPDELATLRFNA